MEALWSSAHTTNLARHIRMGLPSTGAKVSKSQCCELKYCTCKQGMCPLRWMAVPYGDMSLDVVRRVRHVPVCGAEIALPSE